jgi:hypothetical protein
MNGNISGFIDLVAVEPREDYTLLLTFETGEKKVFDFKPNLRREVFKPLNDISLFMQAYNAHNGVVWNDDIDIASEHLYYNGAPVEEADARAME